MRIALVSALLIVATRALTPLEVRKTLALAGESTASLKRQLRTASQGTQNGVAADDRCVATVEALCLELESRRADDAPFPELEGEHELLFTTTTGGSSGKLGPFVGYVTQTFLDARAFENAVALGPLKVVLRAAREPLDARTYRVSFESLTFSLLGFDVASKPLEGGGTWKLRYVDDEVRVMDAPSLFVLARKQVGLRDVLADPARFMEDE